MSRPLYIIYRWERICVNKVNYKQNCLVKMWCIIINNYGVLIQASCIKQNLPLFKSYPAGVLIIVVLKKS